MMRWSWELVPFKSRATRSGYPHPLRIPAPRLFQSEIDQLAIVLNQCLLTVAAIVVLSHDPALTGTWNSHHTVKPLTLAGVGAGYDAPGRPVPLLNQGLRSADAEIGGGT